MKSILLFGAGKSASVCIEYLGEKSKDGSFKFIVADANAEQLKLKTALFPHINCVSIDIKNAAERLGLLSQASVVISMLPPSLHILVARDCVTAGVNLLTASYLEAEMKELEPAINDKGLLFICELGLDPGIDHMSAMQIFENIKNEGGKIVSFKSHCGGLVAPECDDNPWHYKISWNPSNVVNAGKGGAIFLQNNILVEKNYEHLFEGKDLIITADKTLTPLGYYPNRDSITYIEKYGLTSVETFLRTTLRSPDFLKGWDAIVKLKLTETENFYDTEKLSVAAFLEKHLLKFGLNSPYLNYMQNPVLNNLFKFLGLLNTEKVLNIGLLNTVQILQNLLEQNLKLLPSDKDMIVMIHEVKYLQKDISRKLTSSLVVKGKNSVYTAMAATVGLPLAITAILILENKIDLKGLFIPTNPKIYKAVLSQLALNGLNFQETDEEIS